jgi:CubicO group peptidase (beta-lactamase class C family)
MRHFRPVSAVLLALIASATAGAQNNRSDPTRFDSIFAFATTKTPGCAMAAIRNGVIDVARGYGMADLEHGVPITRRTPFYLASVSKQFTAGAINLLVAQGKLSLDDDARKFAPELPSYEAPITIRQLVNHTSGLRDYLTLFSVAGLGEFHITNADFLEMLGRQRSLNFRPGTAYSYSNSNYVLLGIIVERVTGKSLRVFAQERIFEPLGMASTVFRDRENMLIKGRALAYYAADGTQIHAVPHFDVVGDGGLFSTVEDLARWERHLIEPRFGGARWVALTNERGRLADGTQLTYGAGLTHGTHRGETTVEHGGGFGGYSTYLMRFPRIRLSVAVLCNGGSNAGALAQRVANVYLNAESPAIAQAAATPPAVRVTRAELQSHTGMYFSDERVLFREIVVDDGKLHYSRGPTDRSELAPLGGGRYQMVGQPLVIMFFGRDSMKLDAPGSPPTLLRRVVPGARASREHEGTYVSSDLAGTWTVRVAGSGLTLKRPRGEALRVEPAFADAFRNSFVFVRFRRDEKGAVVAMEVSGGERARHIRFDRRESQ